MILTTTHKQAIVYKWKKNSCDYIMAIETYTKKKIPILLKTINGIYVGLSI
jgi:hypothetical protein